MLKDITIGQHFPGNSVVHRMDGRFKILLTVAFLVVLFMGTNTVGLMLSIGFVVLAYAVAKIPAKLVWRTLKPILPIITFTTLLNLLFSGGEDAFFKWWVISISAHSIYYAIIMTLRIVCLVAGTGLLTYTTSPIVLTDAIERLLSPLKIFKFPAHELAMIMTIALRSIPMLLQETDKIMSAQKARGAELDSGPISSRIKALVPILIPLFVSVFRRSYELATAMEARCYHGGEGRTRLRTFKTRFSDILLTLFCLGLFVIIAISGQLFPSFLAF